MLKCGAGALPWSPTSVTHRGDWRESGGFEGGVRQVTGAQQAARARRLRYSFVRIETAAGATQTLGSRLMDHFSSLPGSSALVPQLRGYATYSQSSPALTCSQSATDTDATPITWVLPLLLLLRFCSLFHSGDDRRQSTLASSAARSRSALTLSNIRKASLLLRYILLQLQLCLLSCFSTELSFIKIKQSGEMELITQYLITFPPYLALAPVTSLPQLLSVST